MTILSALNDPLFGSPEPDTPFSDSSTGGSPVHAGDVVLILGAGQAPDTYVQRPLENLRRAVQQLFEGNGGHVKAFNTPLWHTETLPLPRLVIHKDPHRQTLDQLTEAAYQFALCHYNRHQGEAVTGGKLLIVGFSYGGVLANHLAKRLGKVGIPKKLLVMLDAALGPDSHKIDRVIEDDVAFCYNVWQQQNFKGLFKGFFRGHTLNNPLASYGSPCYRNDGSTNNIVNIEVKVRHGYVVYDQAGEIIKWVRQTLESDAVSGLY